jgi:hypothetical protein
MMMDWDDLIVTTAGVGAVVVGLWLVFGVGWGLIVGGVGLLVVHWLLTASPPAG